MVNKKNNVPYYIVGSLATLALLASGVFAAAPYVQVQFLASILAPIAALGLSVPLIAVCAAFSAVVIAFSAIAVNKNRTISEQETQLADKTKVIETQNQTLSEKETQLAEKDRELKDKDMVIFYMDEQLAGKDVVIAKQETQLAERTKRNVVIASDAPEDEQFHDAESGPDKSESAKAVSKQKESNWFNTKATELGEAFTSTKKVATEFGKAFTSTKEAFSNGRVRNIVERDILLPSVEMATELGKAGFTYTKEKLAKAYMVPTEIGESLTEKVKAGEWFSQGQVLGAGIATFGFASLLAQYFSSVANNSTGVDDLHNDGFSISEAGILAMFGFMGLAAQCFTGSTASALSFANKPINSVNDHNNPSNPGTMLDDKLNQTEKMLNLSHKRAEKHFGADPEESTWKGWFFSLFSSKDTTYNPESDSNVPLGFDCNKGKVGQNGSIQAKEAVVGGSTQVGPKPLANDSINIVNDRNNSASSPANLFNPQIDELNQIKAKLEAAEERGEENFGATDTKHSFCVDNGTATTVLDFIQTPCSPGNHQVPLPGLQGMTICCPSIPRSAPSPRP